MDTPHPVPSYYFKELLMKIKSKIKTWSTFIMYKFLMLFKFLFLFFVILV